MTNQVLISAAPLAHLKRFGERLCSQSVVAGLSITLAFLGTLYSYLNGYIIAYGDAESHLNIAKRVVDSLTPGFAQLGGIWLPLPHILLMPFVYFDYLWRSGLAGSIVSGTAFIISAVFIFKFVKLITESRAAAFVGALVFMLNPNVLYMQSTPMTELSLIVFFILSSYYFVKFLKDRTTHLNLILAAFFGFCATLSRYDGWGLVLVEAGILGLLYFPYTIEWVKRMPRIVRRYASESLSYAVAQLSGRLVLFSTLAFFGILIWIAWGYIILGDPLYFTHSQFSAKSQQSSWLARGELPAYHNILISVLYYFVTSAQNVGIVVWGSALAGFVALIRYRNEALRWFILLILLVPFLFNVATLYLGQSVIFLPGLTPATFEWTLFNVRYGIMMVPCAAVLIGFLFYRLRTPGRVFVLFLITLQIGLFGVGYSRVLALDDGVFGLSSAISKQPDAQQWIAANYDYGLLLEDDFARSVSILRTDIPMKNIIYIGNKPYWEDSLIEPEKHARWIVMQKNDTVWNALLGDPIIEGRLYKYFNKVYTSDDILIFRRIDPES